MINNAITKLLKSLALAKAVHALILCRMEEGKVNWLMSDKLDHLRRAHAQKIVTSQSMNSQNKVKTDSQGIHKNNHTINGQLYRHICSFCHSTGKKFSHPLKDCRNKRQ